MQLRNEVLVMTVKFCELLFQRVLPFGEINQAIHITFAGADPGFPVGGGANPPGGRQHMILPNFAKNCMKLRKFWAVGGARAGCAPPKSATAFVCYFFPEFLT